MPYIKQKDKDRIYRIGCMYPDQITCAGELNYAISKLVHIYWESKNPNQCYQDLNDIVGSMEGAKLEFYRRVVVPYENNKMKENGNI